MLEESRSQYLLKEIVAKYGSKPLEFLISNNLIRKGLIKFVDKKAKEIILSDKRYPKKVQEYKYYMMRNMILKLDNVFRQAKKSPNVRKAIVNSFIQNIFLERANKIKKFQKKFGENPPSFLLLSPGKFCNLKCTGCYANSSSASAEKLDWDILDRIMAEKIDLWGSYFTVISGGEPLLYKSQGKTILDLAKKYQNNYFLMYTNGTLINEEMAKKIAEVGNITPAISVEGFEKETDERRGKGVHKKILRAMDNLKKVGVPFGISVTATKNNAELVVSDEFIDYYFDQLGATYGWIFQIMPIGRANLDIMVTPKQRLAMFRKTERLVKDRKIFIADFWNSGLVSNGCISAGRKGGYLYIEWNGNVSPCVFNPYSPVNINDIYKKGGNLNDVLKKPFFASIRQWQKDYALNKKPEEMGNWLAPCPIKDHYDVMHNLFEEYHPSPIDEMAEKALKDSKYQKSLEKYGNEVVKLTNPIWEKEFLNKKVKSKK